MHRRNTDGRPVAAKELRVLMAANVGPESGGVARHVMRIAQCLEIIGVDVDIMWRRSQFRFPSGVDTIQFSGKVGKRSLSGHYDVLHTHGPDGAVANLIAPKRVA